MRFNYKFSNLCGSVYTGGSVVFAPDGRSLLSPVGNRVTVFDLVNHRTLTLPATTPATITTLAVSPDGSLLIAIDKNGRALCVHLTHRHVLTDFTLGARVSVAAFSPNQRYVAFAVDHAIHVYHCPTIIAAHRSMQRHLVFTAHHDKIRTLEWSEDCMYILSGSDDGTARIHTVATIDASENPFTPLSLAGHRGGVVGAFWGSRGAVLDDAIRVYTVSNDGQLLTWRWQPSSHPHARTHSHSHVARPSSKSLTLSLFGVSGKFILSSKHFFNANTHGQTVTAATIHRTPQSIDLALIAFSSGVFSLYELPSFTLIHSLSVTSSSLSSLSVSSDGGWLALASQSAGSVCVWEWQSESYVLKQQGHTALITCLAYSKDGQFIVTGGDDGRVKLWNSHSGFCFKTFSHHTAPVTSVQFAEVGAVIVSSSLDGTIHAYDLTRYRLFRTLTPPVPVQYSHLSFDPSGELVVGVSNDPFDLHVYSMQTGKMIDSYTGHVAPISDIQYSASLALLFTSSWDHTVKLWDIFNGRGCVETLSMTHEVLAIAVSPRGDQLVAATINGDLVIWSIQDATIVGTIEAKRDIQGGRLNDQARSALNSTHSAYVNNLCYSSDGSSILCGGNTRYVCIYDVRSRLLVKKFTVSTNEAIDGIKDKLNSRYVNDYRPTDSSEARESLPGVKRGERSERKALQSARTRSVRFAPSGSQFACATTEGLLVYSLDEELNFDPIDLGLDTTPAAIDAALIDREFSRALLMALRLNEAEWICRALDAIPPTNTAIIMGGISVNRIERLLSVLAQQLESTPDFEFYLNQIHALLLTHRKTVTAQLAVFASVMRRITRICHKARTEVGAIAEENAYLLDYLCHARQESPVADSETPVAATVDADGEVDGADASANAVTVLIEKIHGKPRREAAIAGDAQSVTRASKRSKR